MKKYRKLTGIEIAALKSQMCSASDWASIEVAEDFSPEHIFHSRFSGNIRLGAFHKEFELAGGMKKHSGLYHVTLHNVSIGDDCCIENVKNYIANYQIGDNVFIENVDIILTDCRSSFGNGVEVAVLNETGGREVMIYDRLSAQTAYIMALYRHRPEMIVQLREAIGRYVESISSSVGRIGSDVVIADAGYIKNVKIGDWCKIEGASRLKNGSINSTAEAPVHVGVNVIGDDFIISSGASVEDGVTFSRCFIGQACHLGHNYSASDSLFFGNCQGENGEACAIFAGPFTVTHHKSTLLIAGMFSFMNAGSGSNQSNHMYKLGPIHQGIMERGAKTSSDSYILWPAKVGAFSLVMGRHVSHQDTSDFPFSYLIEQQNTSYIMPGANLKSVGTIRDAKKWPGRDKREGSDRLDQINYNLLSPYVIQKMLNGVKVLKGLQAVSGENSDSYSYQSGKIKRSSLINGLRYYGMAIDKFLGNSLITRIMKSEFHDICSLRDALTPSAAYGDGDWVDISGMIAPKKAVSDLLDDIQNGILTDVNEINARFADIHAAYYDYEWRWAYDVIEEYYGVDLKTISADEICDLVCRWKSSVVGLDNLVYDDARKEFSLSAMTSFGADGDENVRKEDFMQVRGSFFDSNPFVMSVKEHIRVKSELGDKVLDIVRAL
jgi:acetyltransferase-like isoleucine patch superfamily enzyme